MIRDLRRPDAPAIFALMTREFPEESRLLGGRPEEVEKIVRRALRWDTRFVVGLLRAFGRPVFRVLVVDFDGRPVGMTMLSFSRVAVYVSTVVVDPPFRRRGFAKGMLEEARRTAERYGRKFLVLGVLETNGNARALYDSIGYRPLERQDQFLCEVIRDRFATPSPTVPGIRPFRRSDVTAIVEIARRQTPAAVEEVLPVTKHEFLGSGLANRILATEESAWVLDRGNGPEAHISASVSRAFEAAHLSSPIVSATVDPDLAEALVRTAGAWCASRNAPRILSMVAEHNPQGRRALEAVGFQHAFVTYTLYRPVR